MRIQQIDSPVVCGKEYVGKWYCSDCFNPVDDIPVIRYLGKNGTWGKITEYFDSKAEIDELLKTASPPNFFVDKDEEVSRQYWRDVEAETYNELSLPCLPWVFARPTAAVMPDRDWGVMYDD